ncbi:senescence-associated protein-domain-containing protein [Kalaharituber pfeilii]|nr:senescence-associated protein-domain-containing protein [Kalaharituber pfeilii]
MDHPRSNSFPLEKQNTNWSNDNPSGHAPYNPNDWATPPPQRGEGQAEEGTLILVDLENGQQVGSLGEHINVSGVVPGSQEPVEIDLSSTDGAVTIRPLPPADYLRDSQHPVYANSRLVGTAATASRAIVTGATMAAKVIETGARTFIEKTKPVNTPMTFQPSTHNRVRQVHNFTTSTAKLSSHTIGTVTHHAQNLGARLAGKKEDHQPSSKPGLLNKGLIAFGTVADGIDYASKLILTSSSQAATSMVGHRYGPEAEEVARGLTGSVKNVGLVYVDAAGISRRAIVKSVAKGMVVGRVKGGGEVVFQGNNSSQGKYTEGSSNSPGRRPSWHSEQYRGPPPGYTSGRSSPITPQPYQYPPPPRPVSPLPPQRVAQGPPKYNPADYKY